MELDESAVQRDALETPPADAMGEIAPTELESTEGPPASDPAVRDLEAAREAPVPVPAPSLDAAPPVGAVRAVVIAAVAQVVVNAIAIALNYRVPAHLAKLRGLHHLYDAGQHLAAGLIAAAGVALWGRIGPRRALWGKAALGVVSLAFAIPILRPDLSPFAHRVAPLGWAAPLLFAVTVTGALCVVGAVEVGQRLGRAHRFMAWLGVAAGVGLLIANHRLLRRDYIGTHFYIAWMGAALIAASMASRPLPGWWPRLKSALPWATAALVSAYTVLVFPGNALLVEMLRIDGSVVAPWIARLQAAARSEATIPPDAKPWFRSRASAPPIAPSQPAMLPKNGVVVLLTLEAVRDDVLASKKHDDRLPTLARLRDSSVDFTMARANGSQTVYSLSSMFMGTYFSQQYWVKHPKYPHLFPQDDPIPRFPKYLADAGIPTVTVAPAFWFNNEFGILGGFTEEIYAKDKEVYAHAPNVMDDIIARLERQGGGPLFLYAHFLDSHAPYDRGGKKGSEFERYIGEVAYVDRQLGRLVETLDRTGLSDRTALIVTSDHGEAFGEHGATAHSTNLYDEQVRIPLMIRMPAVAPRKVDAPVTLVDLGPTVLDLMGVATPGSNMGQSLVPFLRGKNPSLHRPIIIETRLKKSLIMQDGFKVVVDDRANTSELYNLKTDPGELRNLMDGQDSPGAARVEMLRLFFDVHTIRRSGYRVPYRP